MYLFGGFLNPPGPPHTYVPLSFPCRHFVTNVKLLKVLTYADLSATTIGISPEFSFYLVPIANAGLGVGRISSGYFYDKL